jgi:predicted phage tail protein
VTLSWTAPPGIVVSYIIEAGSSPGLANLASFPTGSAATTFTAPGVPVGAYYVRVRAVDATQVPGPASNEVVVGVGFSACAPPPPGAPTGLTITTNSGGVVGLQWNGSRGATSYLLEAGTSPGLANLVSTDVGATTTFSTAGVPAGTYFVRVRTRSGCGTTATSSNEVTVVVGP